MTSIIAHRGASADAPENTVEAFRLAWQQGADAIEMDLRLTADGQVIVFHDEDLRRMAGDPRRVRDMTAAELVGMEVGRSNHGRWSAAQIPLLEAALADVPRGGGVFLELKCDSSMLPSLGKVLSGCGLHGSQITLISFNLQVLAEAKAMMPALNSALIVDWPSVIGFERLMSMATDHGIDGLDVATDWPLDSPRVARAHEQGLKVHVWTVDDVRRARELVKAGVDGIATNIPLKMRRALEL